MVPEQTDEVEEKARGGDGHGQEEAGLGDGEAEGQFGERGGGRRLQQAAGPELGRRENHTAAQETQAGRRAIDAHVGERQLLIPRIRPPQPEPSQPSSAQPSTAQPAPQRLEFQVEIKRTFGVGSSSPQTTPTTPSSTLLPPLFVFARRVEDCPEEVTRPTNSQEKTLINLYI